MDGSSQRQQKSPLPVTPARSGAPGRTDRESFRWGLIFAVVVMVVAAGFFAGLFEPLFDGVVAQAHLQDYGLGWLDTYDDHAHLARTGSQVDHGCLAVRLSPALDADEGMPVRAEGTLYYAAKIIGIGGRLESFEDGHLETMNAGGANEKHRYSEQWNMHVMHAIGLFDGTDDAFEFRVAAKGKRRREQQQNQHAEGFHL